MQADRVRAGRASSLACAAVVLVSLQQVKAQEPELDFGDAPDPSYPTVLASNGARHMIVPGGGAPWLGLVSPDPEPDGQPHPQALGDDTNGNDDEDGVSIPNPLVVGAATSIGVFVNGPGGWLDAWVDWNGDGDWYDPGEGIYSGWAVPGPLTINVTAPGPYTGQTFARFRIWSTQTALPPTGLAPDGEVEDHEVWIEGEGTEEWKWRQPPDLTPEGFDVESRKNGAPPILLADDFKCTQNSTITNIVIWGSWLGDEVPMDPAGGPNPSNVVFTLSFHADVKKGLQAPWSMPGQILWYTNFPPGAFRAEPEFKGIVEGWYNPATTNWTPNADWTCWRYTFPVDSTMAFVQTGSVDNAVVYWLDVQAQPLGQDPTVRFGWKTTPPEFRWNDDAVWAPAVEPYNGFWWDMHYPPGHPYHLWETNSFDQAFMLLGGPVEEEESDWGDAPDPTYPTLFASNGASHRIVPGPWLGGPLDNPDPDPDGQPDPNALGDDLLDANDDENGVVFPQLVVGQLATVQVAVSSPLGGGGVVEAWIDWNGDGTWQHPAELVFAGPLPFGLNPIPVTPPAGSTNGWTFARFRISTQGGLTPTGPAPEGEVEDYQVYLDVADFGDAPDGMAAAGYPTLLINSGAWHVITNALYLGAAIDAEIDGQPTLFANGDDVLPPAGPDDEDGVLFTSGLYLGVSASIQVTTVGAGLLSAWLDGNGDSDWDDPGEQVLSDVPLVPGTTALVFSVPASYVGYTYMRFRYSTVPRLGVRGGAPDGEVEDYRVLVAEDTEPPDYGDAPPTYPVVFAQNGARHINAGMTYAMGALIDAEGDGLPSPAADGDDIAGTDDEDGVLLPLDSASNPVLVQGSNMVVQVVTLGAPWLSAWVDYNGDGDWNDSGEMVAAAVALSVGTNNVSVTAPVSTYLGPAYARFRTSSLAVPLATTGVAPDGEVEDYGVTICQPAPSSPVLLVITNFAMVTNVGAVMKWDCDSALLTQPQACTNLVEASTNATVWTSQTGLGTTQQYTDGSATNRPLRFYRVRAPYVYP